MQKNKEDAVRDFLEMIRKSWTYDRFTAEEIERWAATVERWNNAGRDVTMAIRGTYKQRWSQLQMMYDAFLAGLGYNGHRWRETMAALKKNGSWDTY